jgi:type I restriction enzyme M protein
MLDTQTKRRIDDCRDILVGKLPDPKAQIEQITIGLIYKFMDDMDKEAVELGGRAKFFSNYKAPDPEFPNDRKKDKVIEFSKYAWDKLMHPKVTATEMLTLYSEAIEGMEKNPNIPQLFRDIFNNAYLPYRDPETLKLFLKTIGEFEYTHSEKLGDAFEYLLSVMGSQGDAGQFRTPRHIIDFLVAIIDPDKIDTILDPACGTAGFLIAAYKHILLKYTKDNKQGLNIYAYNKLVNLPAGKAGKPFNNLGDQLTPDDRKKLIQNFVGYDISPDMVQLSLVNLYLHGFNTPNIHEYDTLSSEERWNESYDVILANPPFMSPKGGIRPHKKFTISSNRSEVLFVDYIAEHLNPNGKAGIIVPEGVIFQSGTAYKELRKMLVEHHLYALVSLPAGVFNPYSGVKTSILLMDKAVAKKRDEILFIKIDNDGYNLGAQRTAVKGSQLEEAIKLAHKFVETGEFEETSIAHLVPKAEIGKNGDFNLSGERYKLKELYNSQFDLASLSEIAEISSGNSAPQNQELYENGFYPFCRTSDVGQVHLSSDFKEVKDRLNEKGIERLRLFKKGTILFPKSGASTFLNHRVRLGIDSYVSSHLATIFADEEKINSLFLYHLLCTVDAKKLTNDQNYPSLKLSEIGQIQIPLPPISIQEEIVAEIEGYQKIIDGAKAVVANYKPKIDIDPDWVLSDMGSTANITTGKLNANAAIENGRYPFFTCSKGIYQIDTYAFDCEALMLSGNNASAIYDVKYYKGKFNAYQRTYVITIKPEFEDKLLYPFIQNMMEQQLNDLKNKSVGGLTKYLTLPVVKEIRIPLPDIETQRQIVSQIEKEQALVNANKQLIEIFEQKIKDRIAKVWGASASSVQAGFTETSDRSVAAEPQHESLKTEPFSSKSVMTSSSILTK